MAHVPSTTFGERFSHERPLEGPHLSFDLQAELDRLKHEAPWRERGHNAITLAKYPDLRLVAAVLRPGVKMSTHEPSERVSLQVLSGKLRVAAGRQEIEVSAGHLLVIDSGQAHEIEAREESAFLLTLSRPGSGRG
jgi:quercetin dioxygenase-like cupin family protein